MIYLPPQRLTVLAVVVGLWVGLVSAVNVDLKAISGQSDVVSRSLASGPRVRLSQYTDEIKALRDLYNSTGGPHWLWHGDVPWNFSSPSADPCRERWAYLGCDSANTTILSLETSESGINMFGTLPGSLSGLVSLVSLKVTGNPNLHGIIPSSLGFLANLRRLNLSNNDLSGKLPSSLHDVPLSSLAANNNKLSGNLSVESSLWAQSLEELSLRNNNFKGTLPDSLCLLSQLQTLDLGYSGFGGSLPSCLSSLLELRVMRLTGNKLNGSIPESYGMNSSLELMDLSENFLTGSLPNHILLSTPSLNTLILHQNLLTGKLPSTALLAPSLQIVDLARNRFEGPLPHFVFASPSLEAIFLSNNQFTGDFPNISWSNCSLREIFLNRNKLTGALPSKISDCRALRTLALDFNEISSSLPESIGSIVNLTSLSMSNNKLGGTLPTSLSTLTRLRVVNLANNSLEGTVGSVFRNISSLSYLSLQNNFFFGSVDELIAPDKQRMLTTIDISVNSFSGTLPGSIFTLPSLSLFSAVKNCITGSLPQEICLANRTLTVLALDGLYAAEFCRRNIFPGIRTYEIVNHLTGRIPECLYTDFTRLKTLRLGGNGMIGSFPSDLTYISPSLEELSLSHNRMTGTIPTVIQQHPWKFLDLSFNKFTGYLSLTSFSPVYVENGSSLTLKINRLSGDIPSLLLDAPNLDILTGNMFHCDAERDQLPIHDPSNDSYECGSNSVNAALYGWLVVVMLSVFAVICIHFRQHLFPQPWAACERVILMEEVIKARLAKELGTDSQSSYSSKDFAESEEAKKLTAEEIALTDKLVDQARDILNSPCNSIAPEVIAGDYHLILYLSQPQVNKSSSTDQEQIESSTDDQTIKRTPNPAPRSLLSIKLVPPPQFGVKFVLAMNSLKRQLLSYWEVFDSESKGDERKPLSALVKIMELGMVNKELRYWTLRLTAVILLVFVPINYSLSATSGTFKSSYAWSVSFGFTTGKPPVIVLMVVLGIFLIALFCRPLSEWTMIPFYGEKQINVYFVLTRIAEKKEEIGRLRRMPSNDPKLRNSGNKKKDANPDLTSSELLSKILWYGCTILLLVLNCSIVMGVKMSYIYATNSASVSGWSKQVAALAVSFFEIFWSEVALFVFERIKNISAANVPFQCFLSFKPQHVNMDRKLYSILVATMTWLSIFNNIIAPFVAVGIFSPDCFKYTFFPSDEAKSTYTIDACSLLEFMGTDKRVIARSNCELTEIASTVSYAPPFIYSYQCSSALMSGFTEVFIFHYIIGSVLFPLSYLIMKSLQEKAFLKFDGTHSVLYHFFTMMLPPPLRPSLFLPVEKPNERDKFLNLEGNIITLITDVAILLTFGVIFPPLAVVGCVSILTSTCFFQLQLGRVVVLARSQKYLQVYLDKIINECSNIIVLIVHSLKSLAVLLSFFWSLFLFDAWGDDNGFNDSCWVFAVMLSIPALITFINTVFNATTKKKVSMLKESLDQSFRHSIFSGTDLVFEGSNPMKGSFLSSFTSRQLNSEDVFPDVRMQSEVELSVSSLSVCSPFHEGNLDKNSSAP